MLSVLDRSIDLAQLVLENQRKILNEVSHLHLVSRGGTRKRSHHCDVESSLRLLKSDMQNYLSTLGLLKRDASGALQMVSRTSNSSSLSFSG